MIDFWISQLSSTLIHGFAVQICNLTKSNVTRKFIPQHDHQGSDSIQHGVRGEMLTSPHDTFSRLPYNKDNSLTLL